MKKRVLGRTGMLVSSLSFGCGALGGLFTGGAPEERDRAIARALDSGINYFDTAPLYGDGASERHLGSALKRNQDVLVGTKILVQQELFSTPKELATSIQSSVESSLRRLQRNSVDLLQLHNGISTSSSGTMIPVDLVETEIAPLMIRLVEEGKARHIGFTALGHVPSIIRLARHGFFEVAQIPFNLLDTAQKFGLPRFDDDSEDNGLLKALHSSQMGVIAIRALAGGALSGSLERHPVALQSVVAVGDGPGQGANYMDNVRMARCFHPLVEQGDVESILEAALRYPITNSHISTTAIGFSSLEQLEQAVKYTIRGPLSFETLRKIQEIQQTL